MAAPALAASMADCAICAGVTGTAGLRPGVSAEPVTAHEIMTLRCIPASLATDVWLWRSLPRGWGRSPEGHRRRSIEDSDVNFAPLAIDARSRSGLQDDVWVTRNRPISERAARNLSSRTPATTGDARTGRAFDARRLASHCAL